MKLRTTLLAVGAAATALAAAAGLLSLASDHREDSRVLVRESADIGALSPAEAERRADDLTLWALERVYRAFAEEEEGRIYDALAEATAGPALETLYLQRRASLLDRGLEKADQNVHELELLSASAARSGDRLAVSARWRVLGLVGHEQHRHLRGNAYAADLAFDRAGGLWRITGFTLREIDRTQAGVVVEIPDNSAAETAEAVRQ